MSRCWTLRELTQEQAKKWPHVSCGFWCALQQLKSGQAEHVVRAHRTCSAGSFISQFSGTLGVNRNCSCYQGLVGEHPLLARHSTWGGEIQKEREREWARETMTKESSIRKKKLPWIIQLSLCALSIYLSILSFSPLIPEMLQTLTALLLLLGATRCVCVCVCVCSCVFLFLCSCEAQGVCDVCILSKCCIIEQ